MIGGGKRRVLSMAGREADIVSISNVPFVAVNDAGLTPIEEAAHRLSHVAAGAGDRMNSIDIESSPFRIDVTNDVQGAVERVAAMLRCDPAVVADHPNLLFGSHEQIAETLMRRRELTGVNYVTVPQRLIEAFAPIASLLNGR